MKAGSWIRSLTLSITLVTGALAPTVLWAQADCNPPATDIFRSLVVRDQATITAADFSLSRTLAAILRSSGVEPDQPQQVALLQTLIDTFAASEKTNPESGLRTKITPRSESSLSAATLLDASSDDSLVPVALFNRLDLAPVSVSDCGEYRIVYGFKRLTGPQPRFFLIFEANMPNPGAGIAGCAPAINLWQQLSQVDNPAERALLLEKFYFKGIPGEIEPVIAVGNLGLPLGQVRGNYVSGQPWQLREWKLAPVAQGPGIQFVAATVKATPITAFYLDGSSWAIDPAVAEPLRLDFRQYFMGQVVPSLLAPELSGSATAENLINVMGPGSIPNRFLDFESNAESASAVPAEVATPAFSTTVSATIPNGLDVSTDEIFHRVGTATCAGCHLFSSGAIIGRKDGVEIRWPNDAGFVHVREPNGGSEAELSEALTAHFLPFRLKLFRRALCDVASNTVLSTTPVLPPQQTARLAFDASVQSALHGDSRDSARDELAKRAAEIAASAAEEPGYFVPYRRPH